MISSDWRGWGQGHSCSWLSRSSVRLAPRGLAAATWSPREPVTERYRRFSMLCWTTWPDHPTTNPYRRAPVRMSIARVSPRRRQFRPGRSTRRWIRGLGMPAILAVRPRLARSFPRDHPQLTLSPASAASFTRPDSSRVFHSRPSRVGVVRLVSGLGLRAACSGLVIDQAGRRIGSVVRGRPRH